MNIYTTGATIKAIRESRRLTQAELAEKIGVSDKAVSKWETMKGLPDISLIEPLAEALGVSVMELFSGDTVINKNVSCNMLKSKIFVCPVCGNIMTATGDAVISCCGITLPPLVAEECDDSHMLGIEKVEDEYFITIDHEMTKQHYISFIVFITGDHLQFVKLYPEGAAETRMQLRGHGYIYLYCNRHGLMVYRV